MDINPNDDNLDATPPYFKSWKPVYWIVISNIILIILLLHFFFSNQ